MVSKQDVLLLLTELEESGIDCKEYIDSLYLKDTNMINILKFINNQRTLDLINFYEKLRKSYNHKSSKLYKNIVLQDEEKEFEANKVLTTLSALLNQIFQFKVEDRPMFLKHARADEIIKVLDIYLKTYDVQPAYKLLKLIKADLYVSEYINGRRN